MFDELKADAAWGSFEIISKLKTKISVGKLTFPISIHPLYRWSQEYYLTIGGINHSNYSNGNFAHVKNEVKNNLKLQL